jgi:hypothetical protein
MGFLFCDFLLGLGGMIDFLFCNFLENCGGKIAEREKIRLHPQFMVRGYRVCSEPDLGIASSIDSHPQLEGRKSESRYQCCR